MQAVKVPMDVARDAVPGPSVGPAIGGAALAEEVPFGIDELLTSRTDARGVLISGNRVFQRVAGYPWEDLVGAPHRIIRHPETPRGLFALMWRRLKDGKPVGAYVRNRARDGQHYWVFAVITPADGGYLSVGIKPSAPPFAQARAVYAALVRDEAEGRSPEASAAILEERLGGEDGAGYDGFMARAMLAELAARRRARGHPPSARLDALAAVGDRVTAVTAAQTALLADFSDIRSFPTNLRIAARRLETSGAPVASLAENYRVMADEISGRIESLTHRSDQSPDAPLPLSSLLAQGQFLSGAVDVLREAATLDPGHEHEGTPVDTAGEAGHLSAAADTCSQRSRDGLVRATQAVARLSAACADIRKLVLGLNSIRVLCRVEAGRLLQDGEALHSIIARLDSFHAQVDDRLGQVDQLASDAHGALSNALTVRG